jgi:hypothetical protein
MSALACFLIAMLNYAVGLVWKIVDEFQYCNYLEARGSGRRTGELAINRLESRGSGRIIRPGCPGFIDASFAGLSI